MALELNKDQRMIWNALKKRIKYVEKKKSNRDAPTIDKFIEKERRKNEIHTKKLRAKKREENSKGNC